MAIEEKVIQTNTEPTETASAEPAVQPPAPNLDSLKAEYESLKNHGLG